MARQRDLFDPTIQQRFEEFHAAHPDVYAMFVHFASELRRTGRRCYGCKAIMERIRWHFATSSQGGNEDDFKLNNNFASRYVRKLIEEHPEFNGFFELRRLKAP